MAFLLRFEVALLACGPLLLPEQPGRTQQAVFDGLLLATSQLNKVSMAFRRPSFDAAEIELLHEDLELLCDGADSAFGHFEGLDAPKCCTVFNHLLERLFNL